MEQKRVLFHISHFSTYKWTQCKGGTMGWGSEKGSTERRLGTRWVGRRERENMLICKIGIMYSCMRKLEVNLAYYSSDIIQVYLWWQGEGTGKLGWLPWSRHMPAHLKSKQQTYKHMVPYIPAQIYVVLAIKFRVLCMLKYSSNCATSPSPSLVLRLILNIGSLPCLRTSPTVSCLLNRVLMFMEFQAITRCVQLSSPSLNRQMES